MAASNFKVITKDGKAIIRFDNGSEVEIKKLCLRNNKIKSPGDLDLSWDEIEKMTAEDCGFYVKLKAEENLSKPEGG